MAKVIGIISIKGGVGKTTTVVSLAKILANEYKQRVLVIDANFSAPNLRIYLGLEEPKQGIHQMLQESAEIEDVVYSTAYGFNILPAKLNNERPTKVSALPEYIERLRSGYDFILIDSSHNVNIEILATIRSSDELFVVVNPDYATLSCTLRAIKIANENDVSVSGVIANKIYGSRNEVGFKEIENIIGSKIVGIVPYHLDIHESVLKRVPLDFGGRKKYAREFSEIAKFIVLSKDPSKKLKFRKTFRKNIAQKNRAKIVREIGCR